MRSLSPEQVELIVAGGTPDFDTAFSTFAFLTGELISRFD